MTSRGARATLPHVSILLCTCNGAEYLPQQLASFEAQTHTDWSLWVSDDGSADATLDILDAFSANHPGRVRLLSGPRAGSAANFLSLLEKAEISAGGLAAFSDQDDVWIPTKLERALDHLSGQAKPDGPAFYSSRNLHVTCDLQPIGPSRAFGKTPAFGNALTQNVLSGHALTINEPGVALLRETVAAANEARVPFHDWWTYQVAAGAGAWIVLDREPTVLYRQHDGNLLGANIRGSGPLARFAMMRSGHYAEWIGRNLRALDQCRHVLTPSNLRQLDRMIAWRGRGRFRKFVQGTAGLGIYRQSLSGNVALDIMARCDRI